MEGQIDKKIGCCFTPTVTDKFIAKDFQWLSRVPQGALERLERYAGKLARTVLRGLGGGNASRLLGGVVETSLPLPDSKCAMQEALRDLEKAFKHFFRRCRLKKQGKWKGSAGYPQFKTKKK